MEPYKQRMINEFNELKERTDKLENMLRKYYSGNLEFVPSCPIYLLEDQIDMMRGYLNILSIRAEIENIKLK